MVESVFELCFLNYLTYYCILMQPPLATSSPTSKVHVKNTSEVRERSVSVNVVLETADSRASPRPEAVAVGERVRAHNGDLHVVRLASDSSAAATASSSASVSVSRLEQLSARVSYLEAELASRQRKFDDERATWLLEKDKVLTLSFMFSTLLSYCLSTV